MNDKIQNTKNPTVTSEMPRAKAGYSAWCLHTALPRGWADHLSRPLDPPLSSPCIRNQLAPPSGSEQGNLLLVFTHSCCSMSPSKALPEFLVWPLINFYWLRRPRTVLGNILTLPHGGSLRNKYDDLLSVLLTQGHARLWTFAHTVLSALPPTATSLTSSLPQMLISHLLWWSFVKMQTMPHQVILPAPSLTYFSATVIIFNKIYLFVYPPPK